jgi:hypothetical protein
MATGGVCLLLATLLVFPAAARTDIQTIQNGDTIFMYEQGLDITGLGTGANPVTSLRKFVDDDPSKALIREVAVPDDTSFTLIPESFGGQLGIYYAFNPTDGAMGSVLVKIPSVTIDVVLANPHHADVVSGFSVSPETQIAIRITSPDVGSSYHAGALYPATVDLLFTTPGGGQLRDFQGVDFSRINLSSAVLYTDDPGMPGAITFKGLEQGPYQVQAEWRDPASFYKQAPDSNIDSFTLGAPTPPPTTPRPATTVATTVTTVRTTVTTPAPTTPAAPTATPPTPEITTSLPTVPPATSPEGTPAPAPTPTPAGIWPAVLSPALAVLPLLRDRKRR